MATTAENLIMGKRIRVRGLVQGVGFRPAVWRLAHEFHLTGHVLNDGDGVLIHIWGEHSALDAFSRALQLHSPSLARIDSLEEEVISGSPAADFQILASRQSNKRTGIVPDAATCPDCLNDINDPANRRFRYPLTNCTNCGPRLSIIDTIPYDRINTSMAAFTLCPTCRKEYEDPQNRRFHAQPNACPECGPRIWLEPAVKVDDHQRDIIEHARQLLTQGYILAIKGIGGFHLACDATNQDAVSLLRQRKRRPDKPFALMAGDLEIINRFCRLDNKEKELLTSPAAPVVLLDQKPNGAALASAVAPGQKTLGFMLPYTPLHHLLLKDIDFPVVMTSGNTSHAPQLIDNNAALSKLQGIADFWLLHDREIRHRIDDSVTRITGGKQQILRRARGYAPAPIPLPPGFEQAPQILALGSELKNTFCLIKDRQAILSQHMGDLENFSTLTDYKKNLALYQRLYEHQPTALAVDAHPEYLSSKQGHEQAGFQDLPVYEIQHHHAHIASCLADNHWPLDGEKVLGVVLDGLGFGDDGALWGGEFILADYQNFQRLGSLKPAALLGASQAMQQPWRNTYAQIIATFGWEEFLSRYGELELATYLKQKPVNSLNAMLNKGIHSPLASSCGRLFDAVAAAIGICREKISYEGQAAIELEALVDQDILKSEEGNRYPFTIHHSAEHQTLYLDPASMWIKLCDDLKVNTGAAMMAARFHSGLAKGIIEMVIRLTGHHTDNTDNPVNTILLSGGVFQNGTLFTLVSQHLEKAGYKVLSHRLVPTNDGGLALGQAMVTLARILKEKQLCA